jgi:hypothetical protein
MHTEFWWGILLENDQLLRLRRWEKNIKWVVMTAVIEIGSGLCPMAGMVLAILNLKFCYQYISFLRYSTSELSIHIIPKVCKPQKM